MVLQSAPKTQISKRPSNEHSYNIAIQSATIFLIKKKIKIRSDLTTKSQYCYQFLLVLWSIVHPIHILFLQLYNTLTSDPNEYLAMRL